MKANTLIQELKNARSPAYLCVRTIPIEESK